MNRKHLWASSIRRCLQVLVVLVAILHATEGRADDVMTIKPVTALLPGGTGRVAVELANTEPVVALQFDIELSEGLAVAMKNGKYSVALTSRATSVHQVSSRLLSNGYLRVAAFSMSNAVFSGESGAIVLIDLDVADDCGSEGTITLHNVRLTHAGTTEQKLDDISAVLPIGPLPGDADGNGELTIADVVAVVSYLLGQQPAGFVFSNADLDSNGLIRTDDLAAIVNIILGKGNN